METATRNEPDTRPVSVGDIFSTSWGYDQTNVEFFEVVRVTKASAVLRRIGSEVRDGRLYPRPGAWATDWHLMGNPGTPSRLRDEARGYSEKMCRLQGGWRGEPWLRIDDVRGASRYTGGGEYDTHAAGQPGH